MLTTDDRPRKIAMNGLQFPRNIGGQWSLLCCDPHDKRLVAPHAGVALNQPRGGDA
jgi:hypothetical protein